MGNKRREFNLKRKIILPGKLDKSLYVIFSIGFSSLLIHKIKCVKRYLEDPKEIIAQVSENSPSVVLSCTIARKGMAAVE